MPFAEHLARAAGSLIKARRTYIAERRWSAERWYIEWQRGPLAAEVVEAVA